MKSVHYTIDNGLPTNNVYSCIQDHNGYIWMATDNGVVKYNGYSFKILTIKDGLPQNDVWRLYEDIRGRIWVFTFAYTFGYIRNDKYVPVIREKTKAKLWTIAEVNNYLIYTDKFTMGVIDSNDVVWEFKLKNNTNIVGKPVVKYNLSDDANLIAIANTGEVYKYDFNTLESQRMSNCSVDSVLIESFYSTNNIVHDNKQIGIGMTPGNKLFIFDYARCSSSKITFGVGETLIFACLGNDVKKNKGYYVFTDRGVYILNKKLAIVDRIPNSCISNEPTRISYLFIDSNKSKWVSTYNSGVYFIPPKFPFVKKEIINRELNDAKLVGSTYEGSTYWWKKFNNTLYTADSNMNIVYSRKFDKEVFCVSDDNDTQANIAFVGQLYKLRLKDQKLMDNMNGKFLTVQEYNRPPTDQNWLAKNTKYELGVIIGKRNVIEQYDGTTLMTAGSAGIYEIQILEDSVKINWPSYDLYSGSLHDKKTGFEWFYNEEAIFLTKPHTAMHFLLDIDLLEKIGINHIISIQQNSYGNIYILTNDKLVVYNEQSLRVKYFPLHLHLENARMNLFNDVLVLAGPFGVAYANVKNNDPEFKLIPNPSSLYYKRIYDFAINRKGKIILRTDKGIYVSDIQQLITSKKHYEERMMDFMNLTVHYGGNIYKKNKDTITIQQDDSKLIFDLVNFYGKDGPSYTYRIGNGSWQISTSGEMFYDWLPGKYYRVECIAGDALWKSRRYTFYIMQAPYWWQTTTWKRIFWAGGILLLIGLGIITALVTRYYVRRKSEKKQALTDMELRALYAQINPHFIFNTLGTAQFFINRKKMDEAYNHVNKFARLLRAYLKASSSRYVNLGEEIGLLKDYIELQQIRFEQKFEYKITVDNKIAKDSMQIPSLLLQPLVENAINHGLFHLPEGSKGMLEIRFEQGENSEELICYIEDNGVGRERSKTLKKDSTIEKDKSYGTTLTKKLIDIFKEYEKMNIYIEYVDKPAPETGTIVKLTIGNVKYTV